MRTVLRFRYVVYSLVTGCAVLYFIHRQASADVAAVLGALTLAFLYEGVVLGAVYGLADFDDEKIERQLERVRRWYLPETLLTGAWIGFVGRSTLLDVAAYLLISHVLTYPFAWLRDLLKVVAAGRPLREAPFRLIRTNWEQLLLRYGAGVLVAALVGLLLRDHLW